MSTMPNPMPEAAKVVWWVAHRHEDGMPGTHLQHSNDDERHTARSESDPDPPTHASSVVPSYAQPSLAALKRTVAGMKCFTGIDVG